MSVRKSKLDLLVRVRYRNPLPAPPFPPKLLDIPTHPSRYARADFAAAIANETLLPMIVDAECGMPLDLTLWDSLWDDKCDDSALNPDPNEVPPLDPKDAFLLEDPTASSGIYVNGHSTPQPTLPHVPWLRKTEYISREGVNRGLMMYDVKHEDKPIDVSRGAQIQDVEESFKASEEAHIDLKKLKHPTKNNITAVDSYELLPDVDIWANAYDLFRFSERPGERHADVDDPRLDVAILRPMESDGDHFLAYYLPKDDEDAEIFKIKRRTNEGVDEETIFSFIRDYETVKIEQDVPNEFLLVLDDGEQKPIDDAFSSGGSRGKGAYYKNIERKIMLKKKRVNPWESMSYADKWDAINLTLVPFTSEDLDERTEALAEVNDPLYMFSRVDADGEAEDQPDDVPMEDVKPTLTVNGHHDENEDHDMDAVPEVNGTRTELEADIFG